MGCARSGPEIRRVHWAHPRTLLEGVRLTPHLGTRESVLGRMRWLLRHSKRVRGGGAKQQQQQPDMPNISIIINACGVSKHYIFQKPFNIIDNFFKNTVPFYCRRLQVLSCYVIILLLIMQELASLVTL